MFSFFLFLHIRYHTSSMSTTTMMTITTTPTTHPATTPATLEGESSLSVCMFLLDGLTVAVEDVDEEVVVLVDDLTVTKTTVDGKENIETDS